MADVTAEEPTQDQIEALRELHRAANKVVAAWSGTEIASAAAMIAGGARRGLATFVTANGS